MLRVEEGIKAAAKTVAEGVVQSVPGGELALKILGLGLEIANVRAEVNENAEAAAELAKEEKPVYVVHTKKGPTIRRHDTLASELIHDAHIDTEEAPPKPKEARPKPTFWTREEDETIVRMVEYGGQKWSRIAAALPGRTAAAVRVHDAFVVRYEAQRQAHLPLHMDESQLRLTIVLNEGFEGGATTFYLPESDGGGKLEARGVRPRQGAVLCFPQGNTASLLHEGSAVTRGTKLVIRSDVLYMK